MISTHLTANLLGRAEEDFSFKKQNVDNLIDYFGRQSEVYV